MSRCVIIGGADIGNYESIRSWKEILTYILS